MQSSKLSLGLGLVFFLPACGDPEEEGACSNWDVTYWTAQSDENCVTEGASPYYARDEVCALPDGWEPFAIAGDGYSVWLRRCN
jgi:hypothetical protein